MFKCERSMKKKEIECLVKNLKEIIKAKRLIDTL